MVSTLRIFSVALALALNMLFSSVVDASMSSSSSHSQRISAADGPFVRGLMAADSQLLYMTVSETNRGGGSVGPREEVEEKVVNNTPMMHVHRARETAINFADVVRRKAFFSPVQSRGRSDGLTK